MASSPNGIQSFFNNLGDSPVQSAHSDGAAASSTPVDVQGPSVIEMTTEHAAPGTVVTVISNLTTGVTSNASLANSRAVGVVFDDTNPHINNVAVAGPMLALFVTDDGAPAARDPVYLAGPSNDAGAGVGKLTPVAPTASGTVVAEVGYCVDASTWAADKTATIVWQPKTPLVNP